MITVNKTATLDLYPHKSTQLHTKVKKEKQGGREQKTR